jgi:hypothetical protein
MHPTKNKGMNPLLAATLQPRTKRRRKLTGLVQNPSYFSLALKAGTQLILSKGQEIRPYARACPCELKQTAVILTDGKTAYRRDQSGFI